LTPPGHPRERSGLDRLLSDPTRLAVMSALCAVQQCDFAFLRDSVSLTDSALSKQIATLKKEGYVDVERTYSGRIPRTWVGATDTGRSAFLVHVGALRAIVDEASAVENVPGGP
jgi:DNA-binding transcriptional ArsR family regulator